MPETRTTACRGPRSLIDLDDSGEILMWIPLPLSGIAPWIVFFIVWDRLFRTFRQETFRPHYGLTKQVDTFSVWRLQTHEYLAIGRDLRAATRMRDRLGYVFGPPGWRPKPAISPHTPAPLTSSR
jgi:hypothetical protein